MNVEKNILNDGVFTGKHGFNITIQLLIVISNILGAGSISEYGFDWYVLPSNIEELIPIINKSIAMEAAWSENIMNGKAQGTVNEEFDVQAGMLVWVVNVKQANLDLSKHTDATISKLHEIAVQATHLPAHLKLLHSENKIAANELSEQLANIKPINVLS